MDMSKYILTSDGKIHVRTDNVSLLDVDEKFEEAARLIILEGRGSASILQRRLEVGYARAARILDQLEQAGILGRSEGNKPREVIISSFDEFIKSDGKEVGPEEVFPEDIKKEWAPKEIADAVMSNLQKEALYVEGIMIPVGMEKKRMISASLDNLGHIYIFNSPMCNSIGLLKSQLEFLTNTYSPDALKLIVSDDTRLFSNSTIADSPHMLTPVIYDQSKVQNALGWVSAEIERRFRILQETGVSSFDAYGKTGNPPLPRIICVVSSTSSRLAYNEDCHYGIENILNSGHLVGVHLIVASPLIERKFSKLMTSFPTKIIFKTFSASQADLLGTDDAFDLTSGDEFVFVPAYGEIQKLKVNG